jgi:hypothetical protein
MVVEAMQYQSLDVDTPNGWIIGKDRRALNLPGGKEGLRRR